MFQMISGFYLRSLDHEAGSIFKKDPWLNFFQIDNKQEKKN